MVRRFEGSILRALGRPTPSLAADGAILTALFGTLASACFADVLEIGIQTCASERVLTDGARRICLNQAVDKI